MAFVVPTFVLKANKWANFFSAGGTYAAPTVTNIPVNLTPGKRVFSVSMTPVTNYAPYGVHYSFPLEALWPALTDVRCEDDVKGPDLVEIPQGSGRLYTIFYVDDIAKGFANEHRFTLMHRVARAIVFTDTTIAVPEPLT